MRMTNRECRFLEGASDDAEMADYREYVAGCNSSVELFTKLYMTYNTRGISLLKQGRHEESAKAWLEAVEYNASLARLYCRRGTAYYQLGEYERALSDFNQTVELEPDNFIALHNRGCAHNRLGRHREAESDFMRAMHLNADLAAAYTDPEVFTMVSVDEDDLLLGVSGRLAFGR
jgi:tetratricopeptide (TPR) repeat protein